MLDIKLLEKIIPNIDKWTYGDLKKIKLMEEKEMTDIIDCWNRNYSMDVIANIIKIEDVLRLCITALYYMKHTKTISICKDSIKTNTTEWERLINKPFKPKDCSLSKHKENAIKESERVLTKGQSASKCGTCYYDDQTNSGECYECVKGIRDNFTPKSL